MPLFYIFYIVVGVSVAGIGYVIWLMSTDSDDTSSIVEKIAPEELRQFDRTGKINTTREKNSLIPKSPGNPGPLQSTKKIMAPEIPDKKSAKKPARKPENVFKLLGGKKEKRPDLSLNDINIKDPDQIEPKKSNSLLDKLTMKLSFGKNKMNPQDDIPEATKFTDLTKNPSNRNRLSNKELPAEPLTGTASLTTTHYDESGEVQPDKIPENASIKNDLTVMKRELESSAQLEQWKEKYEKLDGLYREKSQQLEKAGNSLNNELKNRDDFFKLKAILESEIKEVKDRARELQHSLKNARMETEQQKIQAEQLRDKVTELEEAIQEKNQQLGRIRNPDPSAGSS